MRFLYLFLLDLHPQEFVAEYGSELLWIFEEETARGASKLLLLADGALSLARQWIIRRAAWKWAVGIFVAGTFVANTLAVVFLSQAGLIR